MLSPSLEIIGPGVDIVTHGTIRLPNRDIDYRARASLAAWFQPLALRFVGLWDNAKLVLDSSVFTRSQVLEAVKDVDLRDADLARALDEVIKKAGSTGGLPPDVVRSLEALKVRAEGGG